ncbi:arylesterase [Kangiella japonica]|uniref:Arylesterase n=1 Tax=Kangiella japonica TaxID=647384 RepID=A0ABP3CJS1_9GAMM
MNTKILIFGATLVLLAACSGKKKLEPLPSDATIVAFGDSLTDGVGASAGKSYPDVLSQLSGLEVINAGVSGEVTAQGVQRLPLVLETHDPDLVILMEGGNDILRNLNQAQTKSNLSKMIEMIRLSGAEVVLIGIPEKSLFSDSAGFYEELALEHQVVFDGETMSDLLKTRSYKSDSIHLNNEGYQVLAETIYELLQEQGAL